MEGPVEMIPIAALESEGGSAGLAPADLRRRRELVDQIRRLPAGAMAFLRHFQTQIGCLNRCGFCSQAAGTTVWNLPRQQLANLIAALKTVALEHAVQARRVTRGPLTAEGIFSKAFVMPAGGLLGHARTDRPGVIYCYLDNDPAAYPHLDDLIQWLHQDLGVRMRIATVGFSRKNSALLAMHQRISKSLMQGVAGLRLSFSPYTYGWSLAGQQSGSTSREEFELDTAALLETYRSTFLSNSAGRKGACVEVRFKPLVVPAEVAVTELRRHLVIISGPYLVVTKSPHEELAEAKIANSHSHAIELSRPGVPCWLFRAAKSRIAADWATLAEAAISCGFVGDDVSQTSALLHRLANDDGPYFGVDVERSQDGTFSKFFYARVGTRPGSGYIDGERYFLNQLIAARNTRQDHEWVDIDALLQRLRMRAESLRDHDPVAADYVAADVLPVVTSVAAALQKAGYPASSFFDRNFLVDTGHICNLGRAFHEYRAIASRPDLPVTPNHERAYGLLGELAEEGEAWRLAVAPVSTISNSASIRGARNTFRSAPSILVERLDLSTTATKRGQSRGRYFLDVDVIDQVSLRGFAHLPLIPGHR
jgi:hypothetical protein